MCYSIISKKNNVIFKAFYFVSIRVYYTREKLIRPTYFSCVRVCWVSRLFHSLLFKHPNNICSRIYIMELLIGSSAYCFHSPLYFRDSSDSIAIGHGLHCRGSIPGKVKRFFLRHRVHIGFAVHLAFCTIGIGGTAEAWIWPLTSIECRG
jgi:hypothetical protein